MSNTNEKNTTHIKIEDSEIKIKNVFSNVAMFASIAEHEGISSLTENSKIITVSAGQQLVKEGERGDTAFIILSGKIEVLKKSLSGDNFLVATVQVDNTSDEYPLIGEQSLVTRGTRSATIRTLTEVTLLELHHKAFKKIAEMYPAIGVHIYRSICYVLQERLRVSNNNVVALFQEYLSFMSEDLMDDN